MERYHKCCQCGSKAKWKSEINKHSKYLCDECLKKAFNKDSYIYNEEGFKFDQNTYFVLYDDLINMLDSCPNLPYEDEYFILEKITTIFIKYKFTININGMDKEVISYNDMMSNFAEYIKSIELSDIVLILRYQEYFNDFKEKIKNIKFCINA